MNKKQHFILFLPAILLLSACEPKIDNRGYVNADAWQEAITVGSTSREEILARFGSPSVQSSFGDETWYYISARKETTAFFKPDLAEQQVVRLVFDENGLVSSVESYDKENSQDFDLATRVTPTEGHKLTFIEQLIGNIGRFNRPGGSGASSAAPGRQPGSGGL
ncbi:MAG: outer membrane protein assembly factor BamE [Rickettsiales bacterium]